MRWIVGDIQGCAREFDRLLESIEFDPSRDEIWAAGDIVNRGPDSLAAMRLWCDSGARGVLGNHDVYALRAHARTTGRKRDTLSDLLAAADAESLLDALRRLPLLVWLPSATDRGPDVWLVHAGLSPLWTDLDAVAAEINGGAPWHPRRPLDGDERLHLYGNGHPPQSREAQIVHDEAWLTAPATDAATRLRCCDADGNGVRFSGRPEDCPEGYRPWDSYYDGQTLVVHGHWARRGYYRGQRTLGLDDGCVYGGTLTAWCQDEDRIVKIPAI